MNCFIKACKNNNIQLVTKLLRNPKINPSYDGDLAIKIAIKYEYIEIVKLLLQDPRVDASNVKSDNPQIIKLLRDWNSKPRSIDEINDLEINNLFKR